MNVQMEQVIKKINILIFFFFYQVYNASLNACMSCHSDCVEGKCLELSFEDSNSDKCTNCSDVTKFLDGTLFTGGPCVDALNCPSGTCSI